MNISSFGRRTVACIAAVGAALTCFAAVAAVPALPEGYISGGKVPLDPWGSPYEYQAPGQRNAYGFDIWSFGADGQPGGKDVDSDIGNWSEDTSS